jgi:hypothetical protein
VFEGKCLKDGLRNGTEASMPVRLAHLLRRAPCVGGVGLGCQPIRFAAAAKFGALSGVLPDGVSSESESPQRTFRRGLNSCDDENVPVICPTCQII